MNSPSVWNFAPLLNVALMGFLLALGPLTWLWLRQRHALGSQRVRSLTVLALFLTFDLVLFGAYTRLSDSGLGCPDWPGCYGHASPVGAHQSIAAAQSAAPMGPVTHRKAWIEMVHRYFASAVGVLILVLTVACGYLARRQTVDAAVSRRQFRWALLTLVWVIVQGLFGAFTVTLKLYPAIVTAHLLGGLLLLALLAVQVHATRPQVSVPPAVYLAIAATAGISAAQIALGGWVSTNYAVLACTDFPTCHGQWWPRDLDFASGFTLLRHLGQDGEGGWISMSALTAIHMAHRVGAGVTLLALLGLAIGLQRLGPGHAARPWAWGLLAVALWQFASGLGNVVLGWPLAAALAHTAGAAALTLLMTGLMCRMRPQQPALNRGKPVLAQAAAPSTSLPIA